MTNQTLLSERVALSDTLMGDVTQPSLARRITKAASKQTYYTIRFLVDSPLVERAYNAYAYFRWVDDMLDHPDAQSDTNLRFIERQCQLLEGKLNAALTAEEGLLADLLQSDSDPQSGLRSYIDHMMQVMAFDAARRYRVITGSELANYTDNLAAAVTDALHYFIGHNTPPLPSPVRYLAVSGAHITHLLRDTMEDIANGYYNIPSEYLITHQLEPTDTHSPAFRSWVMTRVGFARQYFKVGRRYLAQVPSWRCRMAGYAYTARFEQVLDTIQRDDFWLRPSYSERKTVRGAFGLIASTLAMMLGITAEGES